MRTSIFPHAPSRPHGQGKRGGEEEGEKEEEEEEKEEGEEEGEGGRWRRGR